MNKINLQHAGWADLWNEIGSISPDFDGVLLRARQLARRDRRESPARNAVLAHLGQLVGEVA